MKKTMQAMNRVICPSCNDDHLILKYVATYEYSYILDSDAPGLKNTNELLPHMYDKREQKDTQQYIECRTCGISYPCYFDRWTERMNKKALQDAVNSAYLAKQHLDNT
ncbi:hypothetical protein SAMN04515679_3376 [Pelosinus fermentans]|uniref:Uncharacterized protein n=1 Tax=Pelosinus fermentans B4 TaxID=1149862 RepID=I9B173_9FIRM|nr:hypothetical protein FB4_0387 [Pelosinus fermentans B4]EIW21928.1 hypothetical protein FA11_0735 [Pelosinus fermentans A11]OAM95221.1 hypothetical protein FR7_03242 [Pelosinus fermentans DSM 17108]SDR24966.1 hypothetical protein SAMN04515679_3376 [Pelosinus fermentans]